MPYTLTKGLGWFLLALVLGIVIGWLIRTVAARREVARARAHDAGPVELERLRRRIAELEAAVAERDALRAELEVHRAGGSSAPEGAAPAVPSGSGPSAGDLAAAGELLGSPIVADDLKVVVGIGPTVEQLCHGIGIRTWHDLATTEVSLLRTLLADAGPRVQTLDPSTWPRQAALLAAGRWEEYRAVADELQAAPPPAPPQPAGD